MDVKAEILKVGYRSYLSSEVTNDDDPLRHKH
jgi:hypothetical protein